MPSKIDPTRFSDGQPVSKAELRAALSSAKAELEHGGFFKAPRPGAVERRTADKLADTLSARDFGAMGDGVSDDTASIQAAVNHVTTTGQGLFFPSGVYRITSTIVVGERTYGTDIARFLAEASIADSQITIDPTAVMASYQRHSVHIFGETNSIIWGDFQEDYSVPLLYIGFHLTDQARSYSTAHIEGLEIVGRGGYVNGTHVHPNGDQPLINNNQIGLFCDLGVKTITRMRFRELSVGLLSVSGYWQQISDLLIWRCGIGVRLSRSNASTVSNVTCWYGRQGFVFDGDCSSLSGIHCQQVDEELVVISASACTFGPAYFEDTRITDGSKLQILRIGTVENGNQVSYSTFTGIKFGGNRPGKLAARIWAARKVTFIGLRQAGKPIITDTASYGVLLNTDFALNVSNWPSLGSGFRGYIVGPDNSVSGDTISGWLNGINVSGLEPSGERFVDFSVPAATPYHHVSISERSSLPAGVFAKGKALDGQIRIYLWSARSGAIDVAFSAFFVASRPDTRLYTPNA